MKIAAYLLAGIGLGLGFAYWQFGAGSAGDPDRGLAAEDRTPIERRISELETALALERYEREVLEEDLAALEAIVAPASAAADRDDERGDGAAAVLLADDDAPGGDDFRTRLNERFDGLTREQRQINRFIDAGFSADRAQWILGRQEELEMQALQARYEATQAGASAQEIANISPSQMLREELGAADYERYLRGRGRPTTINVREVLSNSPAQVAGLEPGDEIIGYDGKRVFDMNELTSLTYEGTPGETVAIDVLRDGQQIQLYVERGPIGVSGGGRSLRRR